MSGVQATVRSCYRIHGIPVEVRSGDRAAVEMMDLRLRDFRCERSPDTELRLEFIADGLGGNDRLRPPAGEGRPVYDTPYGSLNYFPETDALFGELGAVAMRCDPGRGVARFRCAAFTGRQLYLATHPLATISLMELLERRGLYSLHAGCLASGDARGVLLAGTSGAGKSTLSLALARAGMRFLSDDIVFLARDGRATAVRALGFADTVGISDHAAARFAELRALPGPAADGFPKPLVRIEDLFGAPALGSCEPCALVFPKVAPDQSSQLAPLHPAQALLRLVPDVLLTEPVATQMHLEAIAALLGQVRCYTLRSGTDLETGAELIRALV